MADVNGTGFSRLWPMLLSVALLFSFPGLAQGNDVWEEWIDDQSFSDAERVRVETVRAWVAEKEVEILRLEQECWRDAFIARRKLIRQIERRLKAIVDDDAVDELVLEDTLQTIRPPVLFSSKVTSSQLFNADLRDGPGDFSSNSQNVSLGASIFPSDGLMLTLRLSAGRVDYNFDRAFSLDPVFGDPVDQANSLRASFMVRWRVSRRWSAIANMSVQGSAEDESDFEDGMTYLGIFGASYRVFKGLQLGLGLFAQTRLEEDPRVFPIPIIRWQWDFAVDWTLFFGLPDGLKLSYRVTDKLTVAAKIGSRGALNIQDTRLDRRGFAPRGVLRQTLVPVSLGFDWKILPIVVLEANAGLIVFQRFEIDDRRGRELTDDRSRPQGFLSVNLSVRF